MRLGYRFCDVFEYSKEKRIIWRFPGRDDGD